MRNPQEGNFKMGVPDLGNLPLTKMEIACLEELLEEGYYLSEELLNYVIALSINYFYERVIFN